MGRYLSFWKQCGRALKEGIGTDYENHQRLVARLLFESSNGPEALTTLAEYVARMKPDQTEIYYLTGESRTIIEHSPQLEAFRGKQYEVLYLMDPVVELVVQSLTEFEGKRLRSVSKGKPALGDDEERKKREAELEEATNQFTTLLEALQRALDADIRAVRLSSRLVDAPACLAGEEFDYSPRMEQLLLKGKGGGPKQRRILELNPHHPIVEQLQARFAESTDTPCSANLRDCCMGTPCSLRAQAHGPRGLHTCLDGCHERSIDVNASLNARGLGAAAFGCMIFQRPEGT